MSASVLAVAIAVPVGFAIAHQGFPLSAVELMARDVWVTNAAKVLTGRLNMQIQELNGGVAMGSNDFDVVQDGENVFSYDKSAGTVERIDPSYTTLGQRIEVPAGSTISFGGSLLAVLSPDGRLWLVPSAGELQFDPATAAPAAELGSGAQVVVTTTGTVWAASPTDGSLLRIDGLGAEPTQIATLDVRDFELSAVGERAVLLDREADRVTTSDGKSIPVAADALRIQGPSDDHDFVLVATGSGLQQVAFDGKITDYAGEATRASSDPAQVAAPVVLGDCLHGAWSDSRQYLGVCDGTATATAVPGSGAGELRFRVNRNVIALNDILSGEVWLVTDNMRLVENWDEVTPPQLEEGEEGDDDASTESFEDTLAQRGEQNTAPIARPDDFGIRPGRTTILPVLDNDSDPDGDVLTISSVSEIGATAGELQVIDGGRALQLVPAASAAGTISFRYTITDGRPGGVAEAQVNVTVRQPGENLPPVNVRVSGVAVERGQSVTYNVLTDWRDPDGDDLILVGATSVTGDVVRFRPGGELTFTSTSSELGKKSVTLQISDGTETVTGEFLVDVKAPGELRPIGTPDFATGFVGTNIEVRPLDNDRSPSGRPLALASAQALTSGIDARVDIDNGIVSVSAATAGTYYLSYGLTAGPQSSTGLIRVDIVENPDAPLPPVAVADVAYARPNEPVMLDAIANDQSPSGRVVGIQSIDVPTGSQVSVEVLGSSVLRITVPSGLTSPVTFGYTISDGVGSSTAAVTVVPVPELTRHQAPIAVDDTIKVRAGGVVSVRVLDNDYHPDGVRMLLDPQLVQASVGDGLAFVSGSEVRLQAPTTTGQYSVVYRVTDAFQEAAVARVTFMVLDGDVDDNQPPLPRALTGRVFQGGKVTIDVPLAGIDPDGDGVQLTSVGGGTLGEIVASSSRAFTYQAYADAAGTDTFTYQVRDDRGETSTGEIRIGVIPRPDTVLSPVAVNDEISMRPGRVSTVAVVANDSDPNGYDVALEPELLEVQDGIEAATDGDLMVVTAGEKEGTFSARYRISNGHGGYDDAFVIVKVAADAALQPPTAIDHVIEVKDVVGLETVDIPALEGAVNPGGRVDELVVSLDGPNAASAEVLAGGVVRVTLGKTRQAIAYRLTNEADELSAMAFLIVPPYTSDLPPHLKKELEESPPNIGQNQTKEWRLDELVDVPSGREARIIDPERASAGRGNGDPIAVDEFTIRFTPEKDFRGETILTFVVTDGDSADDSSGSTATIQLKVTVGDAGFADVAPTFANSTLELEAGEATKTMDLRAASSHPNPDILGQLGYQNASGFGGGITGGISGSTLSVQAPFGTKPGTTATVSFEVVYGQFTVPAQVKVVVVPSTRPLPQAVDDVEPEGRSSSSYTISPLANDFNPFASEGQALRITAARIDGDTLGATVSNTASAVTVRTGTAKSGTISVIYTVRDATDTAEREVQGRITVVVASAPEPVTSFTLTRAGTQAFTVMFAPPTSSNGAEITAYEVQVAGTPGATSRVDCLPGASCTFTGRTNGAAQTVTISATNRVGTTWSASQTVTPYGTPSAPTNPVLSTNRSTATATITPTWAAPADSGGGSLTYEWAYTQGTSGNGTVSGTSGGGQAVGAGDYTFQVRACNPGGCSTYVSASRHIDSAPARVWVTASGRTVTLHWENVPNDWGVYTLRFWRWGKSTHPGGFAADYCGSSEAASKQTTTITAGNGSAKLTCSQDAADTYSVEPQQSGGSVYIPHLNVGDSWSQ